MAKTRADQCIEQLIKGFIWLFHLTFVAALRTHLAPLMHKITVHINSLSIFDQEHLVTLHAIKQNRPKHPEIKLLVFIYIDVYMDRWPDHYMITENWPQWVKLESLDKSHIGKWGVLIRKRYQGWILLIAKALLQTSQSEHQKVCWDNPMDLSHIPRF